jgi:hypothetical protein
MEGGTAEPYEVVMHGPAGRRLHAIFRRPRALIRGGARLHRLGFLQGPQPRGPKPGGCHAKSKSKVGGSSGIGSGPAIAQTPGATKTSPSPGVVVRSYGEERSLIPGFKAVTLRDFVLQPGAQTQEATEMMRWARRRERATEVAKLSVVQPATSPTRRNCTMSRDIRPLPVLAKAFEFGAPRTMFEGTSSG